MSNNCHSNHLLQRDGTSRHQRLLKALLPEYVAVDERKIKDLESFALKYAREIQYYDSVNEKNGDWEVFFNKNADTAQRTEPHYALFLSFLQLFRIAQDDLNQLTERHLDYYYREVLQLREKPAEADQVFVIFKLARHVRQHLVRKGTQLKAGKDDSGKDLIYATNKDIVLNTAQVSQLRSVFRDGDGRIYASPVANSSDGYGAELLSVDKKWRTFGKPHGSWPLTDRPQVEVGFAFASPILALAEGDREITITLSLKDMPGINEILGNLNLGNSFHVKFSGEKEWIEPLDEEDEAVRRGEVPTAIIARILQFLNSATTWQSIAGAEPATGPVTDDPDKGYHHRGQGYDIGKDTARRLIEKRNSLGEEGFTSLDQVKSVRGMGPDKINDLIYSFRSHSNSTTIDSARKQIILKRTITKAQDAIVSYNASALSDPFNTTLPVAKITLDTSEESFAYNPLSKLIIESAAIAVAVKEIRTLILQNDQAILDASKKFNPFGIRPVIGSSFYIGNHEVFSKQLDQLEINILWHGLPDNPTGFNGHYNAYIGNTRDNQTFKVNTYVLDKKRWVETGTRSLFASDNEVPIDSSQTIRIDAATALGSISRDVELNAFERYSTDSRKGFLKLELDGTDFGHKDFQSSFTAKVLDAVNSGEPIGDALPKEPYTPEIKEIFLNYSSAIRIDMARPTQAEKDVPEQFFHVEAFGVAQQKIFDEVQGRDISLMPQYKDEGYLYIGLRDLLPAATLSLLFQVAEGSANPDLEPQKLMWSYLSDNRWFDFEKFDILSDSTNGLLTSGIIQFNVSKQITSNNTNLPDGLYWLRALVKQHSAAVSDLIDVSAQALTAGFKDMDNDAGHLQEALPAGTISKLKIADAAIKKIEQPFASFGGKVKEQKSAFYTRVSERLRHKNRAITIWDHERLVLEQFSSVYKVKCLNHTRYTGTLADYSEIAPGHTTIVVVSNVRNRNAVDPLRPKTSLITLVNIHAFISSLNPAFVNLHVKNPLYEEIQIKTNVRLHAGFDNGFYGKQLEDDIKRFLSPWAFEAVTDLSFGGRMHKSVILNFIEELSYIDFIACLEMYHIVKDPGTGNVVSRTEVEEAVATTAVSILGSAGQMNYYGDHLITVLESDNCECDDNEIRTAAAVASADECPCDEDQMFEM